MRTYGVTVVAFCNSAQMIEGAKAAARESGLTDRCQFVHSDLSILAQLADAGKEPFDAITSIGVFEHVHEYEYKMVFDALKTLLKADGNLLLHMMCSPVKPNQPDPWIQMYIFPNSHQNLLSNLAHELEIRDLAIIDVEDIAKHYTYTLDCWWRNLKVHFDANPGRYTTSYMKMMEYYLLSLKAVSAHGFGTLQHILVSLDSQSTCLCIPLSLPHALATFIFMSYSFGLCCLTYDIHYSISSAVRAKFQYYTTELSLDLGVRFPAY